MTPQSACRRYMLVSLLTWLPPGLMMAPMVLLMTERGLTIAEVGATMALYSAVSVALELPTGGLADVLGRRVVLSASAAFTVAGLSLMVVADSFTLFAVSAIAKGVARALSSGPAEAWYVDTLHALEGPDADLKPGLSRGHAMESVALCGGTIVGGLVPLVVPGGLAVPPGMGAAAAVVLLVVALFALPEPPHGHRTLGAVLRTVPATVLSGLRMTVADGVLRRLMGVAVVLGTALVAVELLTPVRLAALTGAAESGATAYAFVAAIGFAGSALGSALAPRVAALLRGPGGFGGRGPGGFEGRGSGLDSGRGSVRGSVAGIVVTALSLAALAATATLTGAAGLVTAGLAYAAMFTGLSITVLLGAELTHLRVTSAERATMTSVSSMSLQTGAGLANLGLASLALGLGTAAAWWLAAALALASTLLFARMPDLRPTPRPALQPAVFAGEPEGLRPV
ncbi:MFS transporter [Nonomuraea sp. NPDC059194]|uniref:MFS transporter n=1 Tax=Nonomuraea sp. NPDC059194 TaxID=3346764 RepID=UPI0036A0F274